MLRTRLTQRFGLRLPVVLAPMCWGYTDGDLAAAVTAAGGLGLFGGLHTGGPGWVRQQIDIVRSRSDGLFGVGFITWWLDDFVDNFRVCLEEQVPVVAFSFGDPTPYVEQAKEAGALVLCQVQSVAAARAAVAAGADVLVAQGNAAGGHTGELSTLTCLSLVLDESDGLPVVAAGGIGDVRALAAVLAAGAEGAWLGTALLATTEATTIPDSYKRRIVASDGHDTVYTTAYDILYDLHFPAGIAARVASNKFTEDWHGRDDELRQRREELMPLMSPSHLRRHDPDIDPTWMGESAAALSSVRPVADLLRDLCTGAEKLLGTRLQELLRADETPAHAPPMI